MINLCSTFISFYRLKSKRRSQSVAYYLYKDFMPESFNTFKYLCTEQRY